MAGVPPSKVKTISNDVEFGTELSVAGDTLVVVKFTATWCAPCQAIAAKYDEFSRRHEAARFLKVDVDQCKAIASRYGVRAIPVFLFFKNRERIHTVKGADMGSLDAAITQHLADATSSQPSSRAEAPKVSGQHNLLALIEKSGSECLNEKDDHPFAGCLTPGASYLESDCDEQLIIALKFSQPIKLHTLIFRAPTDGHGPKTVKLFTNQPHTMDFDQAEAQRPVQQLELTPDDLSGDGVVGLNYVKYQNVQNLTVSTGLNALLESIKKLLPARIDLSVLVQFGGCGQCLIIWISGCHFSICIYKIHHMYL